MLYTSQYHWPQERLLIFDPSAPNYPTHAQTGQAPLGLLNENRLGTISGKELPHSAQANFWLKRNSLIGAVSCLHFDLYNVLADTRSYFKRIR